MISLSEYRYDPLDRFINQLRMDMSACQRFYCESRLATEIQGALRLTIVQHDDQLLAQQNHQGDETATILLATDLQRSVLQTLKANHLQQAIAYSPYGHRSVENGLLSLLGFNGEGSDPVTGHYLLGNGYRAFNPVLMRFNSPDSLSPFGKGGVNSYAYCLGDPVNRNDTTGRYSILTLTLAKLTRRVDTTYGFAKIKSGVKTKDALIANDQMKILEKQYASISDNELSQIQYRASLHEAKSKSLAMDYTRIEGKKSLNFLKDISEPTDSLPRYSTDKLHAMANIQLYSEPTLAPMIDVDNLNFGKEYAKRWSAKVQDYNLKLEFTHQDLFNNNFKNPANKIYWLRKKI